MGDRVLMQCFSSETNDFGPVVYGHWSGSDSKEIVGELKARMKSRQNDVEYASARLVQIMTGTDTGNTGFGIWNTDALLTAGDSHGDAGVVLIDVAKDHEATYIGGYL